MGLTIRKPSWYVFLVYQITTNQAEVTAFVEELRKLEQTTQERELHQRQRALSDGCLASNEDGDEYCNVQFEYASNRQLVQELAMNGFTLSAADPQFSKSLDHQEELKLRDARYMSGKHPGIPECVLCRLKLADINPQHLGQIKQMHQTRSKFPCPFTH